MTNLMKAVGHKCQKGYEIQVLKSAAGYYIGTLDEDGCPNCRLSQCYGNTPDDPIMDTERDCIENQFCNGGQVGGCSIKYPVERSDWNEIKI